MRHIYSCPLRWADMDAQGHVNNVTYADYLQEARLDLFRQHRGVGVDIDENVLVVVRNRLTYRNSLVFSDQPVQVAVWTVQLRAASATLAYEVFQEGPAGRTVYVQAITTLAPYSPRTGAPRRLSVAETEALRPYLEPVEVPLAQFGESRRAAGGHYPMHVRFSDVDIYRHVNNVAYIEYFQEARISAMRRRLAQVRVPYPTLVVAEQDIEYRRPMLLRAAPYDVWSWPSRLGRTSMVVESEICDGEELMARGRFVLVFVDPSSGRPVEPNTALRELIQTGLADF